MKLNLISPKENPLKYKEFRLFLLGHFISFVGSWIQQVAQVWLVYELTGSSSYLGVFTFFNAFPMLLLAFFSGALIDMFDRRKFLAVIVALASVPPFLLGLLTQFGVITFWKITFLAFLSGCFAAIDTPLRQVFISEIVPIKILVKAISFQSLSFNMARMVGPFIAGLILATGKVYPCFYLNAISFFPLFVFLVFFIKSKNNPNSQKGENKSKISIFEAIFYIKKRKNLLFVLLVVATFTFFGPGLMVLLPVIVKKFYHGGGKEFGFISSIVGIGAILGAISVIFRPNIENKLQNLRIATLLFCIAVLVISITRIWFLTLMAFVLIGFAFTNFFPVANSYVQENTPSEIRGRVMSLFVSSFLGIYPIGNLVAGLLADILPIPFILAVYSFILLMINFYLLTLARKQEESIIPDNEITK